MQQDLTMKQATSTAFIYSSLLGAVLVLLILAFWLVLGISGNSKTETGQAAAVIEDGTQGSVDAGIKVLSIRRTASDYMLDFRYRVLDAEKAAALMDRKIMPKLIIEETGRMLQVPVSSKLGPLRQSPKYAKNDTNYFMFFANPGRAVKAGDKVTIVIGDFRVEHLVVE
jgi:hypothetical protein